MEWLLKVSMMNNPMQDIKQIEIKDFSPRDIAIQVMKAIEVADITQWNGKNIFEASDYDAIFQSIEDGVSLAVEQAYVEFRKSSVKETEMLVEQEKNRIVKIIENQPNATRNEVENEKVICSEDIINIINNK